MHATTPRADNRDWAIDGPLLLLSFFAAIPSLLLSAWLVLDWAGINAPNEILWFCLVFLAAIPTAPVALGLGAWAALRRPIALMWVLPASIYWLAWLFEAFV
jgi:hypothetical protein